MRIRTYIALLGWCLTALPPRYAVADDWGTDAGSIIRMGGSDGTVDAAGEGAFFYLKTGPGLASLPRLTVVDSAYNLSAPPSYAPFSVVPNETVRVAYSVTNQGNAHTDVMLRLSAAGMAPRMFLDSDADGELDPGEPELGSLGTGTVQASEDETLAVILQLVIPGGGAAVGGDTLVAGLNVLGNRGTGINDNWPALYKPAAADNGDSQFVPLYLAVNYSDATGIVLQPAGMTVTADDSLVFTVTASDSTAGSDWDVSTEAAFSVTGDTLGSLLGNVYHPAIAGTATVTALFDGRLQQSVTVTVVPGTLASLLILQPAFVLSADTLMQYTAAGFDHDGNAVTAPFSWRVSDPLVGSIDSTGRFTAIGAGETYITAAYRGASDSVRVTVIDDVAPETYVSFADSVIHSAAARITATGTDTAGHRGSPAAALTYRYRVDGDTLWHFSGNGIIDLYPLEDGPHTVVVAAVDTSGNIAPVPDTAGFSVALSPYRFRGGRWQMFSVPKRTAGLTMAGLAGADSGRVNYLYRWDGDAEYDRFLLRYAEALDDTLLPGVSYWLRTEESITLSVADTARFSYGTDGAVYLQAGWNQAANAFAYPVDWFAARVVDGTDTVPMAAAVAAGILENAVHEYTYRGDSLGGYRALTAADSAALLPWAGYWVKAARACTVLLDSRPVFRDSSAALRKEVVTAFSADNWRIRLSARTAYARDDYNYAGILPSAAASLGAFDISEPPVMSRYVSLAFDGAEGRKAHRYRSAGGEVGWDVSVATDRPGKVSLEWDGLDRLPAGLQLYLYDLQNGSVTGLRKQAAYTFDGPAGTRYFRLVGGMYNDKPAPLPVRAAIAANDPNPFRDRTRITFRVPVENRTVSDVTMAVYDARGNRIITLVNGALPAGTYRCTWDGRRDDGTAVPAGIYICRLHAGASVCSARLEVVR